MKQSDFFTQVSLTFQKIQQDICLALFEFTQEGWREDIWDYQSGSGGGITCVFLGSIIEKGGVNFSTIQGKLNKKIAQRLQLDGESDFSATGLSLVLHPLNPYVPTVHMNVRYFDCGGKWWFGGGIDLTPYYAFDEDIFHFHSVLKTICDKFDPNFYNEMKKNCDDYFFIKHRQETRGIGGIFFDHFSAEKNYCFDFTRSVGEGFEEAYLPIIKKRYTHDFQDNNRDFQAYRRGRYVEFNLAYDKGTLFGLETGGRIESILISLPPRVDWIYNHKYPPGSEEAKITQYLKPRDWLHEFSGQKKYNE